MAIGVGAARYRDLNSDLPVCISQVPSHIQTVTGLKDTLSVHPAQFGVPPDEALIAEINKKYANRVLHDLGLCVCLFDLVQAGEGKVRYGDGCLWYKGAFVSVSLRYMR